MSLVESWFEKSRMKLVKLHPRHFWSNESGLTALLIFTLGYLIVLNSLSEFSFGRVAARLFFSLIILAGVLTTFKHRWLHGFAIVLAVASLGLNWVEEIWPGGALTLLNTGLSLIYLGFLLAMVAVQVFGEGPVTGHRIRGAIVVYLLLGGLWSLLYQVVALTIPQAFRLPEGMAGGDPDALQRLMTYYSFTTLTTTGYGDITPIHPVTRTLAMLEALVGQLYPAITLARLVSLAIMHQQEKS
jgi:hypothetical protein